MGDIRDDLKDRFADGKIPRGADFGAMVDSLALDSALTVLTDDFTAFLPDGHKCIVLENSMMGEAVSWSIGTETTGELVIAQQSAASRQIAPTAEIRAWTGMPARFGLWKSGIEPHDKDEDKTLGEPRHSMSFAIADGSWKTVIPVQPGSYSAEIVAYAKGDLTRRPATTIFDDLFFPPRPLESVCHAVVTCRQMGHRPNFSYTGDPQVPPRLQGWWLVFYPWPLAFLLLAIAFAWLAWLVSSPTVPAALAIISLLVSLRLYWAWSNRRRGILFRWHRVTGWPWSSDATHALEMRAGPFNEKESRIRYHVTLLWA
jgi:hypothetical protein